jgi:MFS family permease
MDRFGIKRMMYLDALTFIIIYIIYGFVVWGIVEGVLPDHGWSVWFIYLLFIADRLSMQIGMVNSIYLKSIALDPEEVTSTLSTGISLDHLVSITAALIGGVVWSTWGSQWVFFLAAAFSLGNLYVAIKVQPEKEQEESRLLREQMQSKK